MKNNEQVWNLLWKGLAAGDRNGGPVRLATLLKQSFVSQRESLTKNMFLIPMPTGFGMVDLIRVQR